MKHLKPCDSIWKKRKSVANNKICSFCSKVFAQKSNRDRHVEAVHHNDLSSSEEDSGGEKQLHSTEDSLIGPSLPSMIFTPQPKAVDLEDVNDIPDRIDDTEDLMDDFEIETSRPISPATQSEIVETSSENERVKQSDESVNNIEVKKSRLEQTLGKIKMQLDYPLTATDNVIKKLEKDLHGKNRKEAVKFIHDFI